jgi:hypothetical protein
MQSPCGLLKSIKEYVLLFRVRSLIFDALSPIREGFFIIMPISKENKYRYPSNWKEIRANILERAQNKCEFCGLENHIRVERISKNGYKQWTTIMLTIAHLDHTPENCDPKNLRALCQKCHLALDLPLHLETRSRNKQIKIGQMDLFNVL